MQTLPNGSTQMATATPWYLVGALPPDPASKKITIPAGRFPVGRSSELPLQLCFPSVSKLHAEFIATEDLLWVRDLQSLNGTFVNGSRITRDMPLEDGDLVQLASLEFRIGRELRRERQLDTDKDRTVDFALTDLKWTLTDFQQLMEGRKVIPYYQPVVRLASLSNAGYEVLIRSSIPGLTTPKDLFEAASCLDLEARFSEMCREIGVDQAISLPEQSLVFVNTHPSERFDRGLASSLMNLRARAPEQRLVLELHECAITDVRQTRELRSCLRDLDIELAYDDFGAGQARLLELTEVAPDYLKFDIGLIRKIHLSEQRQQLVSSLLNVAHNLGIATLAEGIESSEELAVCSSLGFTYAQGYLLGRPAPVSDLAGQTTTLRRDKPRPR